MATSKTSIDLPASREPVDAPDFAPGFAQRRLLLLLGGVALSLALLIGGITWQSHENLITEARTTAKNLASALDQHTARTIEAVDLALKIVQQRLESEYGSAPDQRFLHGMLKDIADSSPQIRSIVVLDKSGSSIHDSNSEQVRPVNSADRDFFVVQRDNPNHGIFLTSTFRNRINNQWTIIASRRINNRDGTFAGTVVAGIDPEYFRKFYDSIDVGKEGAVNLISTSGVVMIRRPWADDTIGQDVRNSQLFQKYLPLAAAGQYESKSKVDGISRVFAYHKQESLPLISVVGISKSEILANWRSQTFTLLVAALVISAFIGVLAIVLTRALHRLRKSEVHAARNARLIKTTFDTMDQGLLLVDGDERVALYNSRISSLLDFPDAYLAGKPTLRELVDHQVQRGEFAGAGPETQRLIDAAGSSTEYMNFERTRPNGTVLEIRTVPMDGGGFVRTFADVTARKRVEQAQAESEARYRLLAENSSDLIILTSMFGKRIYVSPAVRSMLGYEPLEFAAMTRGSVLHPDDYERVKTLYEQLGPDCEKVVSTHRIKHRDGHYVWVEVVFTWTHATTDEGEPTVIGAFRDISDRKIAEEARLESESRYKLLAETTSDVITRLSLDFKRLYVSPACRELFGFEPEEMLGNQPSATVHPDDAAPVRELAKALVAGDVPGDRGTVTYRAQHKDGHWIWIEAAIDLVRDPITDRPSSLVCALRDVSARQEQARELEAAKDDAEKAARIKTEFLASMSHELRTPLNSIIGFSGLMIRSGELKSPSMERYARLVEGASTTLLAIVNDVLDVSKIEAGGIELDPHPFELRSLVEDAVELVHHEADAKGLPLKVDLDEAIPASLVGDANRIRQVLLNLLSNAVKFTSSGHVAVSVALREVNQAQCRLSFAVEDTGIGVPIDKQHRLFKRFSQVDGSTARQFGGTGLGLSICKSLIEIMGGKIEVVSEPGKGSTFSFGLTLPIAAVTVAAAEPAVADTTRGAFILLAEDVPMNQELAMALLAQQGHRVEIVSDGAAAVDAVMRCKYDLVLMDVQMPVMDGVEATRRIRALGGDYLDLPIIAMTANVLSDDVARFREAGMDDHIGKPFKHDELYAVVTRWTKDAGQRFDEDIYNKLCKTVSEATAQRLIMLFQHEIAETLGTGTSNLETRRHILSRAHRIASTAGMLGFAGLSAKCLNLEHYADSGDDLSPLLNDIEVERVKALAMTQHILANQTTKAQLRVAG